MIEEISFIKSTGIVKENLTVLKDSVQHIEYRTIPTLSTHEQKIPTKITYTNLILSSNENVYNALFGESQAVFYFKKCIFDTQIVSLDKNRVEFMIKSSKRMVP